MKKLLKMFFGIFVVSMSASILFSGCEMSENNGNIFGGFFHTHSYTLFKTVAPTCTSDGFLVYMCSCGDTYNEDGQSAIGHDYDIGVTIKPQCTTDGGLKYTCKVCGDSYMDKDSIIPATGHTLETDSAIIPTCTKTGLSAGSHCTVCGEVIVAQKTLAVIPHKFLVGTWKCSECDTNQFNDYNSLNDYCADCSVSEADGVVTMLYNKSENPAINLHKFAFKNAKTYVFEFGSNVADAKLDGNGAAYDNVRIVVDKRITGFGLLLVNVTLENYDTVIKSNADKLNIGFYGDQCSISTLKGKTGKTGKSYGALQISTGEGNGGTGANANIAVTCSGKLDIICGTTTIIKGGDGGNGGNGGNSDSSGSFGGNGGDGGDGAMALNADQINVSFVFGRSKSDITIIGGAGGQGGKGGYGTGPFWIGKDYAPNGTGGKSALATNVEINYISQES